MIYRAAARSAHSEIVQAAGRFVAMSLVRFVIEDHAIEFDGLGAVLQFAVIEAGGAKAGVVMGVGVPLEAALEVGGGAFELAIRTAFVDVAEHEGRVADLVALRIFGQQVLKQQFGALLVVGVVGSNAAILVVHGPAIEIVGFGLVVKRLQFGIG